jgi:hypothetical protein|tara:strand:+ start:321 stop:455 length:135 start_codon:yes stop_codon:yes gene_type:complete
MKKDLYRFAKARKNKRKEFYRLSAEEIKMIEYNYYYKYNTNANR